MEDERVRVLLIEDNPGDVRLIHEMLAEADHPGFHLEQVDQLSVGLERLGSSGIDVILSDLGLPDSQGFDTFSTLRSHVPEVPIVMLTGLGDQELALQVMQAGAQDYLVKGEIDSHLLARALRYAIERQQAEKALRQALDEAQRRSAETSALLEASNAVLTHAVFQNAARAIFGVCKDLIGADAGYVALLSDDGQENEVLFLDSGGLPCDVDPELPLPIRGLREQAYRLARAVYDNDFAASEWMQFMPHGHVSLENVLFAPLIIEEGRAAGLIGLANKPGGFDENDARMATAFGEIAVIALVNSRTLEALERSEESLRQYSERLEEMVEERTADLKKLVNAMAGREVRMADLKEAIRKLRAQLERAGLEPVANDPLLEQSAPPGTELGTV
jgi:DNA-binding response OmpR family regulator